MMRLGKSKTVATAPAPAEIEPLEALRSRLSEQETELHQLQREREANAGRLGDVLAEKATGNPVDVDEFAALMQRKDAISAEIEQTTLTVRSLREKVDALAAHESERMAAKLAAQLAEASAQGKQHEQELTAALVAVSEIVDAMHANRERYANLDREYRKHATRGHGNDRVRPPFVIPDRVFKGAPGRGQLTLAEMARQWLIEPELMAERSRRQAADDARKAQEAEERERQRLAKIERIRSVYDAAPMPV